MPLKNAFLFNSHKIKVLCQIQSLLYGTHYSKSYQIIEITEENKETAQFFFWGGGMQTYCTINCCRYGFREIIFRNILRKQFQRKVLSQNFAFFNSFFAKFKFCEKVCELGTKIFGFFLFLRKFSFAGNPTFD